jgi:hypothetical protein
MIMKYTKRHDHHTILVSSSKSSLAAHTFARAFAALATTARANKIKKVQRMQEFFPEFMNDTGRFEESMARELENRCKLVQALSFTAT